MPKFVRPTQKEIDFAAGKHTDQFKAFTPRERELFSCCPQVHNHLFRPVKMPGAGDWLHSHKERGQSVRSLTRRSIKAWPHATYDTINIVPCGKFTKDESPPLEKLRELMEIWFGCKCQLAKPVSVEDVAVDGLVDGEQLLVRNASDYLKRLRP